MRDTASRKPAGSVSGASSRRKVTLASALLATIRARHSSPLSRITPFTRPSRTAMRATGASQRISTPRSPAARARAWVSPPMPPRT